MVNGWLAIGAAAIGGLSPLTVGRYLAKRDERRRAARQYRSAWNYLMSQLQSLQNAVNASDTPLKVSAEVRQRASVAESGWRDAANALRQVGTRAITAALIHHTQVTEQKIKAANLGEWPHDDGVADRKLHAAMRRYL